MILPKSDSIAQLAKNMTILIPLKRLILIMLVNNILYIFLKRLFTYREDHKHSFAADIFLLIFWKCNC